MYVTRKTLNIGISYNKWIKRSADFMVKTREMMESTLKINNLSVAFCVYKVLASLTHARYLQRHCTGCFFSRTFSHLPTPVRPELFLTIIVDYLNLPNNPGKDVIYPHVKGREDLKKLRIMFQRSELASSGNGIWTQATHPGHTHLTTVHPLCHSANTLFTPTTCPMLGIQWVSETEVLLVRKKRQTDTGRALMSV